MRTGFKVESTEKVDDYYGFVLDGDHLYMDGNFIVHHNSGKTPVIAQICTDTEKAGGRALVLAHRKELLEQTAEKIKMFAPKSDMGIYSAGLKKKEAHSSVTVAGIQSVYNQAEKLCRFDKIDLVIADECFPADTMISTPRGDVPIEDIYIGQMIFNASGTGVVEAISVRTTNKLILLHLNNGQFIHCTPNHPFFTERGWTTAESLENGSCLFSREDVLLLRQLVSPVDYVQGRRHGKGLPDRKTMEQTDVLLSVLFDCRAKSDAQSGFSCKNSGGDGWADSGWSHGSRKAHARSKAASAFIGAWLENGISDYYDPEAAVGGGADKLQDRHCGANAKDCNRAGRSFTPCFEKAGRRQKKNTTPDRIRVERIEVVELDRPIAVYNIQVSNHPSYYAGGVLVHNCHLLPPGKNGLGMYHKLLGDLKRMNPHVRLIGLTATPYRMSTGYVCDDENFLNEICYEVSVRDLIANGFLSPLSSKGTIRNKLEFDGLHVRSGEFVAKEVDNLFSDKYLEQACREIALFAKNRKSVLVFCASIERAKKQRPCSITWISGPSA